MPYTSVVAREATEAYRDEFHKFAVGTGPFKLENWTPGSELVYTRNPKYRNELYPGASSAELGDEEAGLLKNAGKRLPLLDVIVIHVIEASQPRWLKFRVGDLDFTTVPAEFHDAVFTKDMQIRPNFQEQDIGVHKVALLDYIYRGFNMNDPVFGGEKGKPLRQAIAMAIDHNEFNDAFYNNTAMVYDGPIPPGLSGHPDNAISPYRGPQIARAKEFYQAPAIQTAKVFLHLSLKLSSEVTLKSRLICLPDNFRRLGSPRKSTSTTSPSSVINFIETKHNSSALPGTPTTQMPRITSQCFTDQIRGP